MYIHHPSLPPLEIQEQNQADFCVSVRPKWTNFSIDMYRDISIHNAPLPVNRQGGKRDMNRKIKTVKIIINKLLCAKNANNKEH